MLLRGVEDLSILMSRWCAL